MGRTPPVYGNSLNVRPPSIADRFATAIYLGTLCSGSYRLRELAMKCLCIVAVSKDIIPRDMAALCYVKGVRMMIRIEDPPGGLKLEAITEDTFGPKVKPNKKNT
jgi:hypothetical protein